MIAINDRYEAPDRINYIVEIYDTGSDVDTPAEEIQFSIEHFADWVKNHVKHNGYYERNKKYETDQSEQECSDGELEIIETKRWELDVEEFFLDMDNAVIIEYLRENKLI